MNIAPQDALKTHTQIVEVPEVQNSNVAKKKWTDEHPPPLCISPRLRHKFEETDETLSILSNLSHFHDIENSEMTDHYGVVSEDEFGHMDEMEGVSDTFTANKRKHEDKLVKEKKVKK